MTQSALHPVIKALRDAMRNASRSNASVDALEVLVLLDVAIVLWPTASAVIARGAHAENRLQEFATGFQPPGALLEDPREAICAMHADMSAIAGTSAAANGSTVRKKYGALAGSAHAVASAIELLFDRYYDPSFEVLVAPFLPELAKMLAKGNRA